MSRLDELIAESCPDGVPFRPLGTLGKRNKGTSITAAQMKGIQTHGGPIRVFAGGQTVADVKVDAIPENDVVRVPSIIVKSRGHIGFTYYDKPFSHKSELWSYSIERPGVDQRFVYYYLLTQAGALQDVARATSVKLPQLSVTDTDRLRIPVPPLEVQREIVRILDTFTELEAELEARRRQYEHYREQLLNERPSDSPTTLGHAFEMRSGRFIPAVDISPVQDEEHPFPCYGGNGRRGYAHTASHAGELLLIGRQGALSGNVHRTQGSFYATEHAVVAEPAPWIDTAWAFHKLTAMRLNQYVSQGAQPGLAVGALRDLKFAVPSIDTQRRVADALDKLDLLVNDLSVGLPGELAARRKQYEHYRDKLLSFKEAT